MKKKIYLVSATVVGAIGLIYILWGNSVTKEATLFYKTALQEVGVSEPSIHFETVRNVYAQTLASHNPQFGIAGVNADSLRKAVDSLEQVLGVVATLQVNTTDKKNLPSLYPTAFLRLLANTEDARIKFISSGTSKDLRAYEQAVAQMIFTGQKEIKQFSRTLKYYLTKKGSFSVASPSGTVSRGQLETQLALIEQRMTEALLEFKQRKNCLAGKVSQCRPDNLRQEKPEMVLPQKANLSLSQEIAHIRKKYLPNTPAGGLLLQSSVCMGETSYFLANESRPLLIYIGDIFFRSTHTTQGPMHQYLLQSRNITYTYLNPLQFYTCPNILSDIGLSRAIQETYAHAEKYKMHALSTQPAYIEEMRERDAVVYLRELETKSSVHSVEHQERILLLRMWHERSTGLEHLIEAIASTTQMDLKLKIKGAPFDLNAGTLFLTHSAFPSLFLLHNKSAGHTNYMSPAPNPEDQKTYYKPLIRYSNSDITTRNSMVHDLQLFFRFENLLP